ncbi:YIP1 family protein [Pseudoalteromonas tunicata]|uniref:Yip1 domain-containing protein n=1 Tax=Pseudoalteromonas tunicata D2 TaxID=87626 RepID=A4CE47_9GAMM|nr:YIP1 family protein [Pseudoalteromonas tunicata]ATC93104.1 hypothetical protein PTUN_a0292 [Pseudoalteromonas tunicata]AXT32177.1 YIP1 family protein [Pseudoalteromonas tunicata]EAR26859.1 hypothetical protein PTD2_09773 [Pseudoalteromonas tunicata D2]MDP4984685.1 YIP1 family protein [Pseudoalteromonas tunicata]MDP5215376.1 YIP1 family protein [Pseudoalteromonas tunicata]
MQSTNQFNAILDIFISPTKVFAGLKDAKGWFLMPLILVCGLMAASQYTYFSNVDTEFLLDQQVAQAGADLTSGEQKMIRNQMASTVDMQYLFAMFGGIIAIVVMNAIIAGYYNFVAKQDMTTDYKYGDWYSFGLWTMMPTTIYALGLIALVLTAQTDQLPLSMHAYASLNQLIFGIEAGQPFAALLDSLNIFSFWSIAIAAIGLKTWTNFSMNKAIVFAALPTVVIYVIWAIIAAL